MTTQELSGISHELRFWQGFVKTPRFLNGWVANIKTPELRQEVYDFIALVPHESILDVGSGACSILNGSFPNVQAVDPLGEMYELIFDYNAHGLTPPLAIPAEELDSKKKYDIVHASNSLDHTQHPSMSYINLLQCVKDGGYLIIQGFENEGSFENWKGFHKWNLSVSENRLQLVDILGNTAILGRDPVKAFTIEFEQKNWFIWICQK